MSQTFCNILVVREAQFSCSGSFCWSREGDKSHWTRRYQARLILSERYSLDLPPQLGEQSQNPRFYVYLTMPDHLGSYHPSEFFSTICFLYSTNFRIKLPCTFFCATFKSHTKWSNAQRVSAHTTTALPITAWTVSVMWYTHRKLAHTIKMLQNFLTHPSSFIAMLRNRYIKVNKSLNYLGGEREKKRQVNTAYWPSKDILKRRIDGSRTVIQGEVCEAFRSDCCITWWRNEWL